MPEPRPCPLILLVDDEPRNARILARMLEEDGFTVERCADQKAAMERLSHEPAPDALVADLRSPYDADAMAVARHGRERRPGLPVLLVTTYAEQMEDLQRVLPPPAMVLPKPLEYDALSAELARMVKPIRRRPGKKRTRP